MRHSSAILGLLLLGLAGAGPAAAEVYTVELTNGTRVETRYRPHEAPWDPSVVLLLSEVGNWIGVPRAEVAAVRSQTESRGFGTVIGETTIALGWAPNDAPAPSEAPVSAQDRLLQLLERQLDQRRPDYSVQQFVDPSQAGGIPLWMTNSVTPPLGGGAGSGLSGSEPQR